MVNVNFVKLKYQEYGIKERSAMDIKQMKRRDFLKQIGIFVIGLLALPFRRLFGIADGTPKKTNTPREAKYYTTSDDLLG